MSRLRKWVPKGHVTSMVSMPRSQARPLREPGERKLLALVLSIISTLVVWLDCDSYVDNTRGNGVSFIDALYYSTVTVTTTGYGDITPPAPHVRLLNAIPITPMRVGLLVLLVSTTVAVLVNEGSRATRDLQWRQEMRNHVVVIGYGMEDRSAINTFRRRGEPDDRIVVINSSSVAVSEAGLDRLTVSLGDGARRDLLRQAEVSRARKIIICLSCDDAAILTTLTARQLNPGASIAVDVREKDNVASVRQSGAAPVVTSSDMVGRLLDLSTVGPEFGAIIQDLLIAGTDPEVQQRQARPDEVGQFSNDVKEKQMIGITRSGTLRRFYDSMASKVQTGDQLIVIRRVERPDSRDADD